MAARALVVCVPARNEADKLPVLLDALAHQTVQDVRILIAINNTTDNSRERVDTFRALSPRSDIVIDEMTFCAADAHAGSARRRAMELAAGLAGPDGIIVTTDADTRPPPNWLQNNISALHRGLDIVGGRIVLDEAEPLTDAVAAVRKLADEYWAVVREIEDAIDPVPWDLPPRHGDHTGASLCMGVSIYRRCGGVPVVRSGEDRALVRAAVRYGARLAHPNDIWTRVSPRVIGRAEGGMAEHMARLQTRCSMNDPVMVPSFSQWRARAAWRRGVRQRGGASLVAEREDGLPPMTDDMALGQVEAGWGK